MCKECGQFNQHLALPVWRAKMRDGQEYVFFDQTISRTNGRRLNTKHELSCSFAEQKPIRLRDIHGDFVKLDGSEIDKILAGTLERITYQGEILNERTSWQPGPSSEKAISLASS